MKPLIRLLSLSLGLALALPVLAADDKKDDKKADPKADKKDDKKKDDPKAEKKAEKLVSSGNFVGKVMYVSASTDKTFKVQIQFKYLELDPQAQANIARRQMDFLRQQQQIMMNRNPYQRQQQLAQLMQQMQQQGQQNPYKVKEYKKDFELRAADDIKVRTLQPPIDYDDKGNVKKYTSKELKELKGDSSLPGYQAEFDALREGQTVKVYLGAKKAGPKKVAKKVKKKKKDEDDPDAEADDDLKKDDKPEAVMVVVIAEPKDK